MADTLTVDDDEWDVEDCRNMKRTADQMTIWKREGDKRVAELEAVLDDILMHCVVGPTSSWMMISRVEFDQAVDRAKLKPR